METMVSEVSSFQGIQSNNYIENTKQINSINTFVEYYTSKNTGEFNSRYQGVYNFLGKIIDQIGHKFDPVQYLYNLYQQELTYDEIHSITCHSTGYTSVESTRNLYVNIFKWPSRDKNTRTSRNIEKRELYVSKSISNTQENTRAVINQVLLELENQDEKYQFNIKKYQKIDTIVDKIIYLIGVIYNFNETKSLKLLTSVFEDNGVTATSFSQILQVEVDKILSKLNLSLEIKVNNVRYILKNKMKNKNT